MIATRRSPRCRTRCSRSPSCCTSLAVVAFCAQLAFGRRPAGPASRELVGAGAPVHPPPRRTAVPGGRRGPPRAGPALGHARDGADRARRVLHAGVLVTRGLAAGRLPWGNMYEFATAVVLVAVVAYSVLALRAPGLRHIGAFVLAPGRHRDGPDRAVPLRRRRPAGRGAALVLAGHPRDAAILGFGIFFVSGIASVLYLVRSRYEARVAAGLRPSRRPRRHRRAAARRPRRWTGSRTAPPSSASRSGPSPSSPAPSGPRAPGAGSGAGTPRRPGPSSPGWSTPPTCTPGRRRAGAAGRRPGSTCSGLVVMVFNLLYVNFVSTGLHSYAGLGR